MYSENTFGILGRLVTSPSLKVSDNHPYSMGIEKEILRKHLLLELKKEQLILEDPQKKLDDEYVKLILGDLVEAVIEVMQDSGIKADLVTTPDGVMDDKNL